MVKRQTAILRRARPAPPFWEIHLALEQPPEPGAYVLADLGGPLREPLFPSEIDSAGFVAAVPPGHPALRLLPGAEIDVIGPLGRGFRLNPDGHPLARLLLVAQVGFLPFLQPLFQAAPAVALVVEATTRAQLPAPTRFPPTLELTLVTLDGSAGYLGPLEAEGAVPSGLERAGPRLRELIAWTERACFAFELDRYPALAQCVSEVRIQPQADLAQALVRVPMPCGVGACDACRVATQRGERQACVDGPVFDLLAFRRE